MPFARLLALCLFLSAVPSHAWYENFSSRFSIQHRGTEIQVGVKGSGGAGTVIYLHGFADTMDNHDALLKAFTAQGLKVIAFDYPEHGQSKGGIRWWGLKELAGIIPAVLADERSGFDPAEPVVLAGWSTGATIAIRIAQSWQSEILPAGARLAGIVAFAPALPARIVVNVDASELTNGSMKHGPQPASVPVLGQFSTSILGQSKLAAASSIPGNIPALILVAGDREDSFAQSPAAVRYVESSGAHVVGFQCPGAKHGIEFEPRHGGASRGLAAQFAAAAIRGDTGSFAGINNAACPRIGKR